MEQKVVYLVKVLRLDEKDIDLVETEEFSVANEIWEKAYTDWTLAVSERRPFVVKEPMEGQLMTAFDPSLIKEILLIPIELSSKGNNPYHQRMNKTGLGSMLNNTIVAGQNLDGGYK